MEVEQRSRVGRRNEKGNFKLWTEMSCGNGQLCACCWDVLAGVSGNDFWAFGNGNR